MKFGLIVEIFPGNGAHEELEAMTIRLQNMEEKVRDWLCHCCFQILCGALLLFFLSMVKVFYDCHEGHFLYPLEYCCPIFMDEAVVVI